MNSSKRLWPIAVITAALALTGCAANAATPNGAIPGPPNTAAPGGSSWWATSTPTPTPAGVPDMTIAALRIDQPPPGVAAPPQPGPNVTIYVAADIADPTGHGSGYTNIAGGIIGKTPSDQNGPSLQCSPAAGDAKFVSTCTATITDAQFTNGTYYLRVVMFPHNATDNSGRVIESYRISVINGTFSAKPSARN